MPIWVLQNVGIPDPDPLPLKKTSKHAKKQENSGNNRSYPKCIIPKFRIAVVAFSPLRVLNTPPPALGIIVPSNKETILWKPHLTLKRQNLNTVEQKA